MHQETEGIDIGDGVEVIGAKLYAYLHEHDGSNGVVTGIFTDSQGVKCAAVKVVSESKSRAGKRYFPVSGLKKL